MGSISEKVKNQMSKVTTAKIMSLLTFALLYGSMEIFLPKEATGQIVPDDTLGPETSVVTPANINGISRDRIDGGARRGGNLFHSFSQFNVREGASAYFTNPAAIENIITRVTGSNASNIFGTLGILGGKANLFLINPNGIVFGPNARLDVGGSFVGSSANSLIFENGFEYSATDPQGPPLLTINVPLGLNLKQNPGNIVVQGPGHNLREDEDSVTLRNKRPAGLQVPPDRTLVLVGGDVVLSGGNITAFDGAVELWSVLDGELQLTTNNGQLSLENSQFPTSWGDISLEGAASVDVSGNGGGNVRVQGRSIQLTDGSAIIANTLGNSSGGSLTVKASESVELKGFSADDEYTSRFLAEVEREATGKGGALTISTQRLMVRDRALISNNTFGDGDGGSLTIETNRLTLRDDAQIKANIFDDGNGATIEVRATEVEMLGDLADLIFNGLFADVEAKATGNSVSISIETEHLMLRGGVRISVRAKAGSIGNGGSVNIDTERMTIQDGAQISASTFGAGNAGNINVQGTEVVKLIGTGTIRILNLPLSSGLFATTNEEATGEGGDLSINTDRLVVSDGAQIFVGTFGTENAGNLRVEAREIELSDTTPDGQSPSGLLVSVQPKATGDAGNLTISTDRLIVRDGARVTASTLGTGKGGSLTVEARESVELRGSSVAGFPSLIIAGVLDEKSDGTGGALTIHTARIVLRDGGQISAGTIGAGNGGNVIIRASESVDVIGEVPAVFNNKIAQSEFMFRSSSNADDRVLPNGIFKGSIVFPSGILAGSTGMGDAGNLSLKTGRLSARDGGIVGVGSTIDGNAGSLTIAASEVLLDRGNLSAATAEGDQGNITIDAPTVLLQNNSAITTNATRNATGGNITIATSNLVARDDSDISANAIEGRGGNISITASGVFLDTESEITATSDRGVDGTVEIKTQVDPARGLISLAETPVDASELISKGCQEYRGSEFIITGRGGIPPHPFETLSDEVLWLDWRALTDENSEIGHALDENQERSSRQVRQLQDDKIRQAQGWVQLPNGTVVLTAYPVKMTAVGPVMQHPGCQIILGESDQ